MPLPLPKILYDVQPGGRINTVMNANNALANAMHEREINRVKARYAPWLTEADINSKNAYATLVGLQPAGKLLANEVAYSNLTDAQKEIINRRFYQAGTGQRPGGNTFSGASNLGPLPSEESGNPFADFGRFLVKKATSIFDQPQPQAAKTAPPINTFANPQPPASSSASAPATMANESGSNDEVVDAYNWWNATPQGQAELAKGENGYTPNETEVVQLWSKAKGKPVEIEVTGVQRAPRKKSFFETAGEAKGLLKEGEKLGESRGQAVNDIGVEQKGYSKSGAVIDELINDFTNPEFVALRSEFPYLQNMQLEAASHINDPRVQEMVGKIIGDLESFKAATVSDFKGQTLKREFDFADKIKPSQNDTVYTALGKMQALKALHDIAETKNALVSEFLQRDHMNLPEAIAKANKMVDVTSIREKVRELTQPLHEFENNKTHVKIYLTLPRAKELGLKI